MAAVLNPAAQKSSSDANAPWAGSIWVCPSVLCISGPRISLTHAITAIRSRTAAKTPNTFPASTIVDAPESAVPAVRHDRRRQDRSEVPRRRFGGVQTGASGQFVMDEAGSRVGRIASPLDWRSVAAEAIYL